MSEKIYIEYMGCPQRGLDAGRFADYFRKNGVLVASAPQDADYILFITCACKKNDEDVAIGRIRELGRYRARLIVGGCLKAINRDRLEEVFKGPAIVTSELDRIDQIFPQFLMKFREVPEANKLFPKNKWQLLKHFWRSFRWDLSFMKPVMDYWTRKNSRKYWFVRVGWGCIPEHCTYCSVWKAVGELRSKPMEDCVREFRQGLELGYSRFLFSADNLGAYGLDLGLTLPGLLDRVVALEGTYGIELENCHPRWVIRYREDLLRIVRTGRIKLIRCAIQSGDDRILRLMNRGHARIPITESLLGLRTASPSLRLHTQIIIGFPSETEAEFEATLACVKEIGFDLVFISGYSRGPGFRDAELMRLEIDREVMDRRIEKAVQFFKRNGISYFMYSS